MDKARLYLWPQGSLRTLDHAWAMAQDISTAKSVILSQLRDELTQDSDQSTKNSFIRKLLGRRNNRIIEKVGRELSMVQPEIYVVPIGRYQLKTL